MGDGDGQAVFEIPCAKAGIKQYGKGLFGGPAPTQTFDYFRCAVPPHPELQAFGLSSLMPESVDLLRGCYFDSATCGQSREDQRPGCCDFLSGLMAMRKGGGLCRQRPDTIKRHKGQGATRVIVIQPLEVYRSRTHSICVGHSIVEFGHPWVFPYCVVT